MSAQSAGTVDATAAEPVSQDTGVVREEKAEQTTLLDALLTERGIEKPKAEVQPEVETTEEIEPTAEAETVETEAEPETTDEVEPVKAEDEPKTLPDEWPDSAKSRVKDEAEKRRKRTEERDAAIATAQQKEAENRQLKEQLQVLAARANVPAPTSDDPLSFVVDMGQLTEVNKEADKLIAEAEINIAQAQAQGGEIELQTKNPDGSLRTEVKTVKDLILDKHRVQRIKDSVPARLDYLQKASAYGEVTKQEYPEMFKDSQDARDAVLILQTFPEIRRLPDYPLWIGDALAGRKLREAKEAKAKNGQNGEISSTEKILSAPKKIAPVAVKPRAVVEQGNDLEIDAARKRFMDNPQDEKAREDYLRAKLSPGSSSKQQGRQLIAS